MKMKRRFKKHRGRNRHHFLRAKSKGGGYSVNNLLLMHIEAHEAWHKIFGLKTAEEALKLLERVVRAKKHQHETSFWMEGEIPVRRER